MDSVFAGFRFLEFVNYVIPGGATLIVIYANLYSWSAAKDAINEASPVHLLSWAIVSLVIGIAIASVAELFMSACRALLEWVGMCSRIREWPIWKNCFVKDFFWNPHFSLTKEVHQAIRQAASPRKPGLRDFGVLNRALTENVAFFESKDDYLYKLSAFRRVSMSLSIVSFISVLASWSAGQSFPDVLSGVLTLIAFVVFVIADRKYFVQLCVDAMHNRCKYY